MYQHYDTAVRLNALKLDALRREATHRDRLAQARAARPAGSPVTTVRRALGAALVGLGARLGGLAAREPATRPA